MSEKVPEHIRDMIGEVYQICATFEDMPVEVLDVLADIMCEDEIRYKHIWPEVEEK